LLIAGSEPVGGSLRERHITDLLLRHSVEVAVCVHPAGGAHEQLSALRVLRRHGHARARIGHDRFIEDDGVGPVLDLEGRRLGDLVGADDRECGDDQSGERECRYAEEDGSDESDSLDQNNALMSAVRALVTAGSSAPRTSKRSRTRRRRDSFSSPAVVRMREMSRLKALPAFPLTISASAAAFAASTSLGSASAAAM